MRIVGLLVGVLTLACGTPGTDSGKTGPSTPQPDVPADVVGAADAVSDSEPVRPLSFAVLRPLVRPMALPGEAPHEVTVSFLMPAVSKDQMETMSADTALTITPPVDGTLSWDHPSRLTFRPTVGFAPDTTYKLHLASVHTSQGVLANDAKDFDFEFTTPKLGFLRAERTVHLEKIGSAQVTLVYSGPVALRDDQVRFSLNGAPLPAKRVGSTGSRYTYEVVSPKLKTGEKGEIGIAVSAGVRSALSSATLDAHASKVAYDTNIPTVTVHAARPAEGAESFYVEVLCDDAAVKGYKRYHWDSVAATSYRLSPRCVLNDESLTSQVVLTPKKDVRIVSTDGGFRLVGDLERGNYSLHLAAGAESVDGGRVQTGFDAAFEIPALSPKVEFASKGRYLPQHAWKNLAIRHRNVDQVRLVVRHVPPENLVFWMSGENEVASTRTSNLILDTRVPVRGDEDVLTTSFVDVASLLPNAGKGVYEITVMGGYVPPGTDVPDYGGSDTDGVDTDYRRDDASDDGEGSWRSTDVSRLLITGINVVAKMEEVQPEQPYAPRVHVWALDMATNQPMYGVAVDVVRPSGKALATCETDLGGHCTLDMLTDELDKTPPMALVAKKGEDLTYLRFADLRTGLPEADVHGLPYLTSSVYRAHVYTDRGVYRPGDAAHLSAILRDRDSTAPPADLPVLLEITDPRGKAFQKKTLKANAAGLLTHDVAFSDYASTGRYTARLTVADNEVGTTYLSVEEFVPERMEVKATTESPVGVALADPVNVDVDAKYLFGGSAEGSRVELTCTLEPALFLPANNKQMSYGRQAIGYEKAQKTLTLGSVDGEIGADGRARLTCPDLDEAAAFSGAGRVLANVAVFEAGSGRTTVSETTVPVHPERFYLGLATAVQKVKAGQPFTVKGLVVDWEGKPAAVVPDVHVELFRMDEEYGYVWDEDRGTDQWMWYQRPIPEGRFDVEVGKDGSFTLTATPQDDSASYLVRVSRDNARTDLALQGSYRRYWWGYNESRVDQTPRPLKPTSLAIQAPEEIKVGEPVTVHFEAPYRGRALMTVETNALVHSEWIDVQPGTAEWHFTLPTFAPNVYATAFLVKDPHLDSQEAYLPDRAFGVQSIRVTPVDYSLALTLTVPESVRSNSQLTIELAVDHPEPETWATVAAVDEGILSLTDFASPNPFPALFPKRRLGVDTYETIGWTLALPAAGATSRTGGDGSGPGARVQAVKPVALWSGPIALDADGKASVVLDVPQYRGALRVMGVVTSKRRVGHADARVLVKDPIVLQTTLPRFLTRGDRIEIPVFVTNTSGKEREIEVTLSAKPHESMSAAAFGPPAPVIRFDGAEKTSITLADNKSKTVVFRAEALAQVGAATFAVEAKSGNLTSREELDVPFAPSGPKTRQVKRITLAQGKNDLLPYVDGWLPTTEKSSFWVTSNPYGEVFGHLSYLIHYPYGCIEQTTSATRPLLFVRNLLPTVDPKLAEPQKVDAMVQSGLDRILSMQTPSGGLGYWPGDSNPNLWGTAYGTHLLLDAKDLGYPVPEDSLADALDWMDERVNDYGTSASRWGWYAYSEPYVHYVLARSGRAHKARIQQLVAELPAKPTGRELESEYLLKAALYLAGDRRYENELRKPVLDGTANTRANDWTFYSDLRRRGLVLAVHQELFDQPVGGEGEELAKLVASGLQRSSSGYYTTQEVVWSVTGLGRRVGKQPATFTPPTLAAAGKDLQADPMGKNYKGTDRIWTLPRSSEYGSLVLDVPDIKGGPLYLIVNSEGVREDASYEVGGTGLQLSRSWLDAEGTEVDPANVALGDLVYVQITVTNTHPDVIQNVALVDRFPAGWEVENPRLGRGTEVTWIDELDLWSADYMNVRDDRVELFGTLEVGGSHSVVYGVRAVTAGTFATPPVEAEAMYDPTIWARQDGTEVVVHGGWEAYWL